jgi:hypothetical protein
LYRRSGLRVELLASLMVPHQDGHLRLQFSELTPADLDLNDRIGSILSLRQPVLVFAERIFQIQLIIALRIIRCFNFING